MELKDFKCHNCIYFIDPQCYKDPEGVIPSGMGCSSGQWVIKMLKWRQKPSDKERAYYETVGWSWIASAIDSKFVVLEVR